MSTGHGYSKPEEKLEVVQSVDEIKEDLKAYILQEFLPGESSEALTDETEFINHGVLDSLSTLALVDHIEKKYSITLAAHEINIDNLNRLPDIALLIATKL
ncbi:MAG: acyl carrier protein [Halioglobus sp.]|nr:acyl carrier protein [Halioglobus sp.]